MCGNLGIRFLDSKDPKHTLCHEIAFVTKSHLSRFTRFLGMIFPFFDSNSSTNTIGIYAFHWISVLVLKKKGRDLAQFVNTHSTIAFSDLLDSAIAPHYQAVLDCNEYITADISFHCKSIEASSTATACKSLN